MAEADDGRGSEDRAKGAPLHSSDRGGGGDGNDALFGGSGSDTMSGGDGNDFLLAGTGNDVMTGGDGNDELFGEAGNDRLSGGEGNDFIYGGAGNDTMTGGEGADRFLFDGGRDRITDFDEGEDEDEIVLVVAGIDSFADVQAAARQRGSDLLLDFGSTSLLLEDVTLGDLGADDFLF